jgi:hypothetical protein
MVNLYHFKCVTSRTAKLDATAILPLQLLLGYMFSGFNKANGIVALPANLHQVLTNALCASPLSQLNALRGDKVGWPEHG